MGLAERRAAKAFETEKFPKLKAEVIAAASFEVPIEVDWESLSKPEMSHQYDETWPKLYFTPLIAAFKEICQDDMGKEALKAVLKKIVLTNKSGIYYGDRCAKLESGTLTIDHDMSNVDNIKERQDGIRTLLEKAL